jgi:2-polyprenyl-3-methyl-5-hydroxy-6-metoxy-1,4-benzoquinol methylase
LFFAKGDTLSTMPSQFPQRNYDKRPRRTRDAQGNPQVSPQVEAAARRREEMREAKRQAEEDRPRRLRRTPQGEHALPTQTPAAATAWEEQAAWYDQLHGEQGDDFHSRLVLPAVMEQLKAAPGQKLLDVCCGQGVLGRVAGAAGLYVTGIDASPSLI